MSQPPQNPYQSTPSDDQPSSALEPADEAAGHWWSRILPGEHRVVGWATAWFFCILLGYFIVRPVRETMGIMGGARQLQGLFLVSFAVMLAAVPAYSALVARLPRRWLVRVIYHFFAICLVVFWLLLQIESTGVQIWTARVFFVWVSVFSLFSTSVFWSVLADLFTSNQGKRLFGMIAAGGTAGAITGSLVTSSLASHLSTSTLLLLPVAIIEAGLWCAWRLERNSASLRNAISHPDGQSERSETDAPTGGGLLTGITHVIRSPYLASICFFLFFVQLCGTHMYFMQAELIDASVQGQQSRTQLFAYLDLGTQVLTLFVQFLLTGTILRRLGVSVALTVLPIIYFIGFSSLAAHTSLSVLMIMVIATRAAGYGVTVPSREVLFTVVSREDKYKSKSFIDTVVLRGGDTIASQIFGTIRGFGVSLTAMNLWALPITVVWMGVAWALGNQQRKLAEQKRAD